ncbi:polysaccharide deacetylase family protein [Actinoplanes sp. L3-i22]|uniref:polysaccharide deacetylase family protein n=1 Tax=Actinoplanes sp. L3-i22 TaxID=2836373 RepID=UPI001C75B110|nr:polysaccharide deacetylase family protein [Actinoplanes sp. L3-i22]BCY07210.1 hypothetical protein L3i22_022980 [Actinoplanes sp. L3-i22]
MSDEPKVTKPGEPEAAPPADEATVALPATPAPDEPTVAIPADASPDEPTAATPADEETAPIPADEATELIRPEPEPDEATVAIKAETPGDEKTVAIKPGPEPEPDEKTVVVRAEPPADEKTVAFKAQPVPDEATVAIPAAAFKDDLTVALPAKPPPRKTPAQETPAAITPPPPEPAAPTGLRGAFLTRRKLLLGISGAALTAGAVAVYAASDDDPGKDQAKPTPGQPVVIRSRTPESTVTASPLPVQRKPISTLAEYTKATGGQAFPSDAIALTIDDGPHPIWTPKILQLLDHYQVPAMFCMIGNQVLGHENVAQMVTTAGHQLANHTWSHPTKLGAKAKKIAQQEIRKAQNKISRTTGYAPKLFRSPGGDWSPQLLRDVAQAGLLPLDWSNDPRDWTQPGVAKIESRMLAAKPGQILLCHDGGGDRSQTFKALSVVLPTLKARGLKFVAL